jgi:acyl-CoA thioesterase
MRHSPFIDHCGIALESLHDGCCELRVTVADYLKNSGGILHGGALATLADSAAGAATWSLLPLDKMAVTTDFNLTCLRSVADGEVIATAELIHRGGRFMRAEVKIQSKQQLIATAGVSFMVVDRPQ